MTERFIRVTGKGKVSARPDTIVLTLELSDLATEYEKSVELSATLTQRVRECVRAAGLNADDLKTTDFSVRPEYSTEISTERQNLLKKKTKTEYVLKGYRFSHSLKLEFPLDNKKLCAVLSELARSDTGVEFDFGFTVKDPELLRVQLLEDAARVSRNNAQILASASGAELGEVIQINYSWDRLDVYSHPVEMERKMCALAPSGSIDLDVTPDDIDLEEEVTITWALK